MNKAGQIVKCSLPFFLAIIIQVVVTMIGAFIASVVVGFSLGVSGESDSEVITKKVLETVKAPNSILIFLVASTVVTIIVFGIWYRSLYKKMEMGKLTGRLSIKSVIHIVVLGVALQLAIGGVMTMIQSFNPQWFDKYSQMMGQFMGGNYLLVLLVVGLGAPISEELVFRGVIFAKAKTSMTFWGANILQAILFGIMHGNIIQGIYACILGMFLGMICHKCKSILAPILLHMVFNLSSAIQSRLFTEESLNLGVLTGVILVSVLVVAFISRELYKQEDEVEELI